MDSKQFISDAVKTESRPDTLCLNLGATLRALQFLAAAADVADALKRGAFYGKGLDDAKMEAAIRKASEALDFLFMARGRMGRPSDTPSASDMQQPNLRLLHGAVGIFSESGEMIEAIIKQIMTGELDAVNFAEESGDCSWYQAIIYDETGVSEETTRAAVIAKLKQRYPGKFESDAATTRDLDAERAVLEEGLGK